MEEKIYRGGRKRVSMRSLLYPLLKGRREINKILTGLRAVHTNIRIT